VIYRLQLKIKKIQIHNRGAKPSLLTVYDLLINRTNFLETVRPYCLFAVLYSLLLLYFGQIHDGDDGDDDDDDDDDDDEVT